MLSLSRDEIRLIVEYLNTSSRITLSLTCTYTHNILRLNARDLCNRAVEDNDLNILRWAVDNKFAWDERTYVLAASDRMTRIVNFVRRRNPPFYPSIDTPRKMYKILSRLAVSNDEYRRLFMIALNLELVLKGKRRAYLICPVHDPQGKIARGIVSRFPQLCAVQFDEGCLIAPQHILRGMAAYKTGGYSGRYALQQLLENEYVTECHRVTPSYRFISYMTQHGDHIYGYPCLKYDDSMLSGLEERAASYTEALLPWGFRVSVRVK